MRSLIVLFLVLIADVVDAQHFMEVGEGLYKRDEMKIHLNGALRLRGSMLYNLDLDRGITPSGHTLYPLLAHDPSEQNLMATDTRLRLDTSIFPKGSVAIKSRVDLFEYTALNGSLMGDSLSGRPLTGPGRSLENAIRLRWVYGEARTPLGILIAGRMGVHWGLGILSNDGRCEGCDSGDIVDRVAFVSGFLSHLWVFAFDWNIHEDFGIKRGANSSMRARTMQYAPTYTFAILHGKTERSRARRRAAGVSTFEHGGFISYRTQDEERIGELSVPLDLQLLTFDGWGRVSTSHFVMEVEVAYLRGQIAQPTIVPGVQLTHPVTLNQLGAAMKSEYGALNGGWGVGLDAGYASGDDAPGFAAYRGTQRTRPLAGDVGGDQAGRGDYTINHFRFSPGYHVDRILFRELLGGVTDALYIRPHIRKRIFKLGEDELEVQLFGIFSIAMEPSSTPGLKAPLAVELDPSLIYQRGDSFRVALDYALLLPLEGLDNPDAGLAALTAHLLRIKLSYLF